MTARFRLFLALTVCGFTLNCSQGLAQQSIPIRVERWLELRELTGHVLYQRGETSRSARAGDRLETVGDGLSTGVSSTAQLEIDTQVGFVNASEQTRFQVQSLEVAPDNGRITRLRVDQGQVRLQVRPFTHEGSELEIETPAGISGVRGTDFGLSVQLDGKTGVMTLSGQVDTSAQGQTVAVPAGFQNFTIPGEAPSAAVPISNNTDLDYTLERVIRRGIRRVQFVGKVDPVNLVLINDQLQSTDRAGEFRVPLPVQDRQRLQVTVITPLGDRQVYDLVLEL